MTVDEALYEKIMGLGAVVARVQGRVYRGWRPQETALPCITFLRVDTAISQGSAGRTNTERARFQIDIWTTSQRYSRTIADALKSGLDGWTRTTTPKISGCCLDSEQDLEEDAGDGKGQPEARISQDWIMWYYAS